MVHETEDVSEQLEVVIPAHCTPTSILLTLYEGTHKVANRDAVASYFTFTADKGRHVGRIGVMFSGNFEFVKPKAFRFPENMDRKWFRAECAYASIGEYLAREGLPPETKPGTAALQIPCFSDQFEIWSERAAPEDEEILEYARAKVFACWEHGLNVAAFSAADTLRLHADMKSIKRMLQIGEGEDWTIMDTTVMGATVQPLPAFLRTQRSAVQPQQAGGVGVPILLSAPRYEGPASHWAKALDFMSGETRDLANAAKEAVCTVEGLARVITGDHTATLGELIKTLKRSFNVNPAMTKTLEGIWGFTSNSPGVRHGGASSATIEEREARYVLDSTEATIRFLLSLDK